MKKKSIALSRTFVAFLVGVFIASSVGFVLAHGGDISKIHACVGSGPLNKGQIRIVGANDTCRVNEDPLDWNIQGVQGPAGASPILGFIHGNGTIDARSSSRILSVEKPTSSFYCLRLNFTPKFIQVTHGSQSIEGGAIAGDNAMMDSLINQYCTNPATVTAAVISAEDAPFYAEFFE